MILRGMRRAGKPKTDVLEVGTVVRVESHAIAQTRALGAIAVRAQRHKGALSRYLPRLHRVVARKEASDSTEARRVYLYMVDGREEWFSRNELQVVDDPANLIKPRQREDIMFGQTFLKDAHLRQLHGDAQQQVLDEDQADVEEEETPPVTRAMAQKVDEVLPDAPEAPTGERQSKRLKA